MNQQEARDIILMVADDRIWEKGLCRPLEQQGFRWNNHKYSRDCCRWVFINLTKKELCMGVLGIKTCTPYIDHAISFEDFYLVYEEYKRTGIISQTTRERILNKYKDMLYNISDKALSDEIKQKRAELEAERERQLKLPRRIIPYEEYRELVRRALQKEGREDIVQYEEDYIKSEYDNRIKQLKNKEITQEEFEVGLLNSFVARLLFWL